MVEPGWIKEPRAISARDEIAHAQSDRDRAIQGFSSKRRRSRSKSVAKDGHLSQLLNGKKAPQIARPWLRAAIRMIAKKKWSRPVSRVLCALRRDSHSSRRRVAAALKRPTRERRGPRHGSPIRSCSRWGLPCRRLLPATRWALTPPFHPCRPCGLGGLLSVALSVGSRRPGVTWHLALRSPDFPRPRLVAEKRPRLPGRLQAHSIAITSSTYR